MFNKTKLLAACAAVAIGLTAFASAGEARTYYYRGGAGKQSQSATFLTWRIRGIA